MTPIIQEFGDRKARDLDGNAGAVLIGPNPACQGVVEEAPAAFPMRPHALPWALPPALQRPARKVAGLVPQATLHRIFARSRLLRRLTVGLLSRVELAIMGGHKQPGRLEIIRRVRRERESLLSGNEAFTLHSLAAAQRAIGGVMAEVGVFQGCSAKLISLGGQPSELHLFDTFEGLPEPDRDERGAMRKGHYAASLDAVRSYLGDQPNLVFHKGLFTGHEVACADRRFSLVHLDVDLKEGTRACLDFFYPRMLPGGIIVSHDYSYLDGVREAFAEFLADRPERAIELPSSQVMLIKAPDQEACRLDGFAGPPRAART